MYSLEEFDKQKTKVLKYILYKKRTEQEIRNKFSKTIDENMLEDIIEYLKEAKYIDDNEFIEKTINNFSMLKNLSIKEIQYKLLSKGLSKNILEDYISEHREELEQYEIKSAQNILYKKSQSMEQEEIKQYLLKKGYKLEKLNCKKSLFQIMCEDIKRANEKYDITIPWYIMTSEDNDIKTKKYFKEHDFFGYPKDYINFFKQGKLPLINLNGKLILQETYKIKAASNGNGNVFNAMDKYNIIDDLEKHNIKWISFGGIDNVLLKNVDPLFIGLAEAGNYEIASKSIFKQKPMENTAVYCKKSKRPAILYYDEIDLKLSVSKFENGTYKYREANILSHLMTLEAIKKVSDIHLPYHRAFKKNAFVNEEGMKQVPDKPNSFKFENFIFDAFSHFDDMLLLRVNVDEEFAPIKDFTGIYNPDTAIEKYEKYWRD